MPVGCDCSRNNATEPQSIDLEGVELVREDVSYSSYALTRCHMSLRSFINSSLELFPQCAGDGDARHLHLDHDEHPHPKPC